MVVPVDQLPGFRRRFRIIPRAGRVSCEVEDDFHCMVVILQHDGAAAIQVQATMRRAPWTTCPGAELELEETFRGVKLADFPQRGRKKANCTHLYDLATLAANHAFDETSTIIDIFVSDPEDGRRHCELRRDGECLIWWTENGFQVEKPQPLAGMILTGDLTPWTESMAPEVREAARLLRWGTMLANGRQIPMAEQSDATRMPPNCYTFQPERAVVADRVGEIKDFSTGSKEPLSDYESAL